MSRELWYKPQPKKNYWVQFRTKEDGEEYAYTWWEAVRLMARNITEIRVEREET